MSHIAKMNVIVRDLEALRRAAQECGLELVKQSTYRWYGRYMGGELPEGVTPEDLGKCDYVLRIPDDAHAYEIGVCRRRDGKGYALLYDFWGPGQALQKLVGDKGERLVRSYALHAATRAARQQGFRVRQVVRADGTIELRLSK